jgi:hypothetical protein
MKTVVTVGRFDKKTGTKRIFWIPELMKASEESRSRNSTEPQSKPSTQSNQLPSMGSITSPLLGNNG